MSKKKHTKKRQKKSVALKNLHGFTALELLMALGIMAVTAGTTIPLYRQYQAYADLDTGAEHLVQALRAAQTLSQTGKFDTMWGVYVPEGTLFAGSVYDLRDETQDVDFPMPASIQTEGIEEVTFSRVDGTPSAIGEVCILSTVTERSRTLTIDQTGNITVSTVANSTCGWEYFGQDGGDVGGSETGGASAGTSGQTSGASGGETSGTTGGETSGVSGGETSGTTGGETSGTTGGTTSGETSGTTGEETSGTTGGETVGTTGGETSGTDGGEDGGADDGGDDGSTGGEGGSSSGGGGDLPCDIRFTLDQDEGDVTVAGTNDIVVKVLGSQVTYGAGGPTVAVRVSASTDGGSTWADLYGGQPVTSNVTETISNVPGSSKLVLRFNGRYSWLFNKTYQSDGRDGHVYVLKDGDLPPDYAPFDNQASLASFLQPVIDAQGKINIGPRDLLFLAELGSLNQSSSDFQDAVVLVTFNEKANTCTDAGKPRLKLSFFRAENTGAGDFQKKVYVGPQKLAFAEEQWIPLVDSNGTTIVDGGLVETVQGVALERGNGWVRAIQHGSHPQSGGKEIIDARFLFNKAIITSIVNEVDENKTENPVDGHVDDTANGDEFVNGPNVKSMEFKTRVTTADDGVILYWTPGNPSDAGSSSSSSSASSVGVDTSDTCYVPHTVGANGVVTLSDSADISVRIAGAAGTYRPRGPRLSTRARISFDNGQTWQQLFGYRSLRGGESATFQNVPSGSVIRVAFEGRYSWVFRQTASSGDGSDRVKVLRQGETFSGLEALRSSGTMRGFLRDLLDGSARANAGNRSLLYLAELADMATADYHDAVTVLSIDKATARGGCGGSVSSSSTSSATSSSSSSLPPNADTDSDGVVNSDDLCPFSTVMPESVPTEGLTFDRLALTERRRGNSLPVFREGPREKVSGYSIADTRGCSCEQLLDAIEGKGYHRFEEEPSLYRQMKNLFEFYVRTSRKNGCSESLLRMVSDSRN